MNYGRVVLAGLAGAVAYFVCGGVISGQLIAKEYKPYESVYRSREAIMHYFPMGIAATFIAANGGRLSAESDGPGLGTTMIIYLPATRDVPQRGS